MKKQTLLLSLLSMVFIAGCGENIFKGQEDKSSTEAKQFDISEKLDSGDYQAVLNDPNATATDYAAAAMGLAGLDPVDLIKAMNDAATGATSGDLGPVTSLALDPAALDELQTAKDKLAAELAANPTDPDLNFQMTLTSLTSTLTALAQVGEANTLTYTDPVDSQVKTFDSSNGISTEEADALGAFLAVPANQNVTVNADVNGDGVINSNDTLVALIANDVANIVNTLPNANLGTGSDLNTVLSDATNTPEGLNYGCATDTSGNCLTTDTVTATDISNYLTKVLGQ